MAEHALSAEPTHSRWNADLPPRLTITSGDVVHFECQDSSGAQIHPGMTAQELTTIDRGKVHALTGPVAVHGATPGDVLQIDVLKVRHKGWGWSSVIEGMGFLQQRFRGPFLFHWDLDETETRSLAPAAVPLRPFCGIMGVVPAERGEFRTRAPGIFGGNLDVRELYAGSTLYLPVQQPDALFSCGDAHAAQGDGEVCINGIECPSDVTLRFNLHKAKFLAGPLLESAATQTEADRGSWLVLESATDALEAARHATDRMIDLLTEHWSIEPVHAYLLCSVAMKLQLSQVVNEPMITVAAAISKSVLPPRSLF
ncbi:acetamidase/formamidase family protein [Alloacidobacterium dinghuense]|uniref:Acetamidase/formamidase family protein n=1 Tax=Alloacidobacterium dinghuense TaxID=2763107 RepID=A0A7G8BNZ7_9BACT|nr:acetamidase/formamidase family protein [Alloacidobacterium dinghuense]QNI34267.1 acetamidase/formamidase family protein [Alloacidobacterium dinghuense]